MRIVYLHQYFVTPRMAGGVRSYEMARRLVKAGHEVHMITTDQEPPEDAPKWRMSLEAGVHVHWTPVKYDNTMQYGRRLRSFASFAWRAARKAVELQGDIVFATSTPLTIALPAVYASRRAKVPMVFEVRDLWPAVPIAIGAIKNPIVMRSAKLLERFAYRNATRIVALAPGMRDEIVKMGYPFEHISVIPNGCDMDMFSDCSGAASIRQEYKWLRQRPLLVFTGTFGLVNGMRYLVELAAAIVRLDSEVRIVAVGGGREFDRTLQYAREANVHNRNLFFMGRLPKHETARWVVAADMTISLFTGPDVVWRDAVQNKFFDSLAAGKPVVNNFPGWQSKVAEQCGAGIVVSGTDFNAAARQIVQSLRDRQWLERAGLAARRLAEDRFNRDTLASDLVRVLDDARLIADNKSAANPVSKTSRADRRPEHR